MKEKILTAVSTLMIFIPWTILPLRTCSWALESPAAEIIIYSYAAFMVFSGIFTLLSYTTAGVKICRLFSNDTYADQVRPSRDSKRNTACEHNLVSFFHNPVRLGRFYCTQTEDLGTVLFPDLQWKNSP